MARFEGGQVPGCGSDVQAPSWEGQPRNETEDWVLIRFSSASRRWLWVLNIFSEKQKAVNAKF